MTYSIDGSTYTNTTGVFTSVVPGAYNVSAKCSAGCISAITSVTINSVATEIEDVVLSSKIEIYPVPNNGHFTITINTQTEKHYDISVYNILGSSVYEEKNVMVNGTLEYKVDLSPVSTGIYYVLFKEGNNRMTKKIIIK
jgi:hypothetical protein